MTTSGTYVYNKPAYTIITAALRRIGAIAAGEVPNSQMYEDALLQLNSLVKMWEQTGLHLWTTSEATLFPIPGQPSYLIGPGATTNIAFDEGAVTFNPATNGTSISASSPAAEGDTSIVVANISGIADDDNIGVRLDSGVIQWTTATNVDVPTSTITLASALTDSASNQNSVYYYSGSTPAVPRPLRVVAARRMDLVSQIETPIIMLSRLDYRALPNKFQTGMTTQIFYDPQMVNGVMWLWPAPVDTTFCINFTFYRPIQSFDNSANTPDLPNEWLSVLIAGLAVELAPEFDVPPQRYAMLKGDAAEKLDRAMGWDREPESVFFGVAWDQTR